MKSLIWMGRDLVVGVFFLVGMEFDGILSYVGVDDSRRFGILFE